MRRGRLEHRSNSYKILHSREHSLARAGNDLVAVILPEPPRAGRKSNSVLSYGGEVLAEAGNGLLYVGARGTWYPNRGMAMSDFDLNFRYPRGWTLLATGKPVTTSIPSGNLRPPEPCRTCRRTGARWISERPIPVAGFDLGRYIRGSAQAGEVTVEAMPPPEWKKIFPNAPVRMIDPDPSFAGRT